MRCKRGAVGLNRLISAVMVFCTALPIVAAAADVVAARKDPRTFECKSLPVTALDREAVAFVEKEFLAKYFVQAGNSWFVRTNFYANSVITELRGPLRFAARASPISTADELNGIAWSGQVGIYPRAYRQWRFDAKAPTESVAAEWQDMPTSYCTGVMSNWLDISAKKIEGRWLFEKGAEERFKGFHSPLPEVDVAKGAPYWSTKGATARPASASQLMGVWAGSSPHGPVRFEVKGTTKGEKSGSVAIPKCGGFLWFQGFEGETAIFAEEFPSFFSCWTGSKVRLTLQGPNAASFERIDQKGQAIAKGTVTRGEQGGGSPAAVPTTAASSAGDSRNVGVGSAGVSKQATNQESAPTAAIAAAASVSSLVGRWIASGESKGKPYRYRFDFVEGANGTLSGTFKYEPPGCKGTLVAKSAAPPNYEFTERIDDPLMLLKCGAPAALHVQVPSAGIAVLEKVDPANGRSLGRVTAMLQGAAESPSAAATAVSGESAAAAVPAATVAPPLASGAGAGTQSAAAVTVVELSLESNSSQGEFALRRVKSAAPEATSGVAELTYRSKAFVPTIGLGDMDTGALASWPTARPRAAAIIKGYENRLFLIDPQSMRASRVKLDFSPEDVMWSPGYKRILSVGPTGEGRRVGAIDAASGQARTLDVSNSELDSMKWLDDDRVQLKGTEYEPVCQPGDRDVCTGRGSPKPFMRTEDVRKWAAPEYTLP